MEFQALLEPLLAQYAAQPAFLLGPHRISYGILRRRICSVSRSLLALGYGPGSRVVYLRAADQFYVEFFLACAQIGAAFCPLSPRMPPDLLLSAVGAVNGDLFVADLDFLDLLSCHGYSLNRQNAISFSSSRRYLSYANLTKKQLLLPPQKIPPQTLALCLYDEDTASTECTSYLDLCLYF